MSKLPFVTLFNELCALIAQEFFDAGDPIMEVATREIDQWASPIPGRLIHLPLLGVLFQVSKHFYFIFTFLFSVLNYFN